MSTMPTEMPTYKLAPGAELPHGWDWSLWLNSGETITSSAWDVRTGLTVMSGEKAPRIDGAITLVWLTGGTPRQTYRVTNRITTSAGRKDERSFVVSVVLR